MSISVSDVLSDTLAITKERIGPLAGIYVLFFVIQIAFLFVFGMLSGASMMALGGAPDPAAMGGGFLLTMLVFYLVYFLIYCAQSLSMSLKASPLRDIDIGDAIGTGFRLSLTLLALFIIIGIIAFIGSLIFGLVIGLIAAASGSPDVASAISLLIILPVAIYLMCRLAVVSPLIAVEGIRNPITALTKSWNITGGNVLTIFLSYLLFVILALIPIAILVAVFAGSIGAMTAGGTPEAGFGIIAFGFIAFIVISILFASVAAALVSVLHAKLTDDEGGNLEATFE